MDYNKFLESKVLSVVDSGFYPDESKFNPLLKDSYFDLGVQNLKDITRETEQVLTLF